MKSIQKLSHDDCQLLLPAYLNGKLSSAEQLAVQQHIARCPVCFEAQQEVEEIKSEFVKTPYEIEDLVSTSAMEKNLDKTLAMIDELGKQDQQPEAEIPQIKQSFVKAFFGNVNEQWDLTPKGFKGLIAGQAASILAVVGLLSFLLAQPGAIEGDAKTYQTLSDHKASVTPYYGHEDYKLYRVVFHGGATESNIRSLMNAVEGQIISGPSTSGFYTVVINNKEEQSELILN